jgi:hypothetical protein
MSKNVFGVVARTALATPVKRVDGCHVGNQDEKGNARGMQARQIQNGRFCAVGEVIMTVK